MKKSQTILLIGAILNTAFFGVFAEIRKGYAEDAEQHLKEGRLQIELAEKARIEIRESTQWSAAKTRIAMNDLEMVEKVLAECKSGN